MLPRSKPSQPTLLRRTTAKNMAYLQRHGLAKPFNPNLRVIPTRHIVRGKSVLYTDQTSLGGI